MHSTPGGPTPRKARAWAQATDAHSVQPTSDRIRPGFSDIDAWGLTHPGKLRPLNHDHFFLGALARGVTVDGTSISDEGRRVLHAERLATLLMVADGVGSREDGGEAARIAVRDLVSSVSRFFHQAEFEEADDPEVFSRLLHDAALDVHESLLEKAEEVGGERKFSTTLTLFLGLWPHGYILQVGDSRCYVYRDGRLTQITRDQTWAQELVESGALTRTQAEKSRWADVLSSAMGGEEASPVVTRIVRDWGTILLFCTDGLTKHVSDEQIEARLSTIRSARETAELLLQDALEGGGTDNITIVLGRTLPPEGAGTS